MTDQQQFRLGQYRPGHSWLHRFDARGKLLLLPLLILVTFSASPGSLVFLTVIGILLAENSGLGFLPILRALRPVRWLLLATLLLHMFFTPGRVLGPLTWLSYDGLLLGVQTCSQLLLTMFFAVLLSMTTDPGDLAAALGNILQPFRFGSVSSTRLAELLGLSLQFVPILRYEGEGLWRESSSLSALRRGSLTERALAAAGLIEPLILRLADRAEDMALRMARGETLLERAELPPMKRVLKFQISVLCSILLVWWWL